MTDYICTNCHQPARPGELRSGERREDTHIRELSGGSYTAMTLCHPEDPNSPTCNAEPVRWPTGEELGHPKTEVAGTIALYDILKPG